MCFEKDLLGAAHSLESRSQHFRSLCRFVYCHVMPVNCQLGIPETPKPELYPEP